MREVRFRGPDEDGVQGIVEIALEIPSAVRAGRREISVGGARIALSDMDAAAPAARGAPPA